MKAFVAGATGATGSQLVRELLNRNLYVKVIVRDTEKLPGDLRVHERLTTLNANILQLSCCVMKDFISDCDAVASCLGHNMNFKGIFGNPKYLVTDAVIKICKAIKDNNPAEPVKLLLLNTTANKNKDNNERLLFPENLVIGLMRSLLPPQKDNERAADYLRKYVGNDNEFIKWTVVRPDTLVNDNVRSDYFVLPSPARSPVFNPGRTSRINVGNFMSDLITNDKIWEKWEGKMPVIYNCR